MRIAIVFGRTAAEDCAAYAHVLLKTLPRSVYNVQSIAMAITGPASDVASQHVFTANYRTAAQVWEEARVALYPAPPPFPLSTIGARRARTPVLFSVAMDVEKPFVVDGEPETASTPFSVTIVRDAGTAERHALRGVTHVWAFGVSPLAKADEPLRTALRVAEIRGARVFERAWFLNGSDLQDVWYPRHRSEADALTHGTRARLRKYYTLVSRNKRLGQSYVGRSVLTPGTYSAGAALDERWSGPTLDRPLPVARCAASVSETDSTRCPNLVRPQFHWLCTKHWYIEDNSVRESNTLTIRRESLMDKQALLKAREMLLDLAEPAVEVISDLLEDGVSDAIRLKAATEILDRVGLRGGVEIDVSVTTDVAASELLRERLDALRAVDGIVLSSVEHELEALPVADGSETSVETGEKIEQHADDDVAEQVSEGEHVEN